MRRAVAVLALARADEVRFAAKVSSWWHSDVAPTFETLEAVVRTHLRKKDYGAFQRATGTSVGELLAGLRDSDANASRDGATLPHEALPVVKGVKLAANLWQHLFDFKTPSRSGLCVFLGKNSNHN